MNVALCFMIKSIKEAMELYGVSSADRFASKVFEEQLG